MKKSELKALIREVVDQQNAIETNKILAALENNPDLANQIAQMVHGNLEEVSGSFRKIAMLLAALGVSAGAVANAASPADIGLTPAKLKSIEMTYHEAEDIVYSNQFQNELANLLKSKGVTDSWKKKGFTFEKDEISRTLKDLLAKMGWESNNIKTKDVKAFIKAIEEQMGTQLNPKSRRQAILSGIKSLAEEILDLLSTNSPQNEPKQLRREPMHEKVIKKSELKALIREVIEEIDQVENLNPNDPKAIEAMVAALQKNPEAAAAARNVIQTEPKVTTAAKKILKKREPKNENLDEGVKGALYTLAFLLLSMGVMPNVAKASDADQIKAKIEKAADSVDAAVKDINYYREKKQEIQQKISDLSNAGKGAEATKLYQDYLKELEKAGFKKGGIYWSSVAPN